MEYPTWQQLTEHEWGESDTPLQALLIHAVAALSTQGKYASKTPWEVYDGIVKTAQEVDTLTTEA
jgi:hypothetical protein